MTSLTRKKKKDGLRGNQRRIRRNCKSTITHYYKETAPPKEYKIRDALRGPRTTYKGRIQNLSR